VKNVLSRSLRCQSFLSSIVIQANSYCDGRDPCYYAYKASDCWQAAPCCCGDLHAANGYVRARLG
jgi:hypothetical protein